MKQVIKNVTTDHVSDFLYYDRKEDEGLPVGAIEEAIRNGEVTVEEIVTIFENGIRSSL